MTPAQAISALDRHLAAAGQDAVLRRWTGTGSARTPIDVPVRIRAQDYRVEELVGGIEQGDTRVVLSPTQIVAAGWPGPPQGWPRPGDAIVIAGRERSIIAAPPQVMDDVVVRIDMVVRG
ncbi:hypothetical protein [Xanthobacter sp.]|uniref:hypothetical protein n=1 Tax=Xanthobacter sp. TaxID=35809 RepID=UPI0025D38FF8|nr:hypothetical protein [Xanthobacter sp.]